MDMQDFARVAFARLYIAVLMRAPATPVPPLGVTGVGGVAVKLVNPVDPLEADAQSAARRERSLDVHARVELPIGTNY